MMLMRMRWAPKRYIESDYDDDDEREGRERVVVFVVAGARCASF